MDRVITMCESHYKPAEFLFHIVVPASGKNLYINKYTPMLVDFSSNELFGQNVAILILTKLKSYHVEFMNLYFISQQTERRGSGVKLCAHKKDSEEFLSKIRLNRFKAGSAKEAHFILQLDE